MKFGKTNLKKLGEKKIRFPDEFLSFKKNYHFVYFRVWKWTWRSRRRNYPKTNIYEL
jgi:hypothetical protein